MTPLRKGRFDQHKQYDMDTQSARQKTRRKYEDFEKQLIRLDKQLTFLWKKQQALGWEPLDPPVMKGWRRLFVLREDVAESPGAVFFEGILQKINTVQYSNTRDFTVRKKKRRKKIRVDREQYLLKPSRFNIRRLQLTKEEWAFFAYKEQWSAQEKRIEGWYEFTEPWRFVLRIERNMITRVRIRDEALESDIARLQNYIRQRNLRPAIQKIKRGHSHRWRPLEPSHRDEAIIQNMEQSWQSYKSGERT